MKIEIHFKSAGFSVVADLRLSADGTYTISTPMPDCCLAAGSGEGLIAAINDFKMNFIHDLQTTEGG